MAKEKKESKKGIGYSDTELANMTDEDRNRILKAREDKIANLKRLASLEIEDVSEPSDREYARKFKKMTSYLVKAIRMVKAQRTLKQINNNEAYDTMIELLEKAKEI